MQKERNSAHSAFLSSERGRVLALLGLCLVLFFFGLGSRPLWDVDEGMHAVTSREMVLSGDWVTPTYNGENFYDKPVFYNWLAALSFLILGFTELAARLPAAILGTGCVLVTHFLGRRMLGPREGFLGAAILATSGMYVILSRVVVHDIALTFFITLTLFLFYRGYGDDRHRGLSFLLMYAAGGGAALSKGPVGVLLPAAVIGLFLIYRRDIRFLKQMKIATGLLVFLLVAAPWYIWISLENPDYARYFFIEKNLGSFAVEKDTHSGPIYYYVDILIGGFMPWSCFLPLALMRAFKRRDNRLDDRMAFLLIWLAVVFLFFSFAGSKLPTYILPLFPAAALLVAVPWQALFIERSAALHRGFLYSFLPLLILFPLGLIYILAFPPTDVTRTTGITMGQIYMFGFLVCIALATAFFILLAKRYEMFFAFIIGMVISSIIGFVLVVSPSVSHYRSTKTLAKQLDGMLDPGEDMVFYGREKDSALFYTGRRGRVLRKPKQLRAFLAAKKRVYFIAEDKYLEHVAPILKKAFVIERDGNNMIISNRKAGS